MEGIRAALIDIDGVLTVSWQPLPGAVDALKRLRAGGVAVALVTNTTSLTRASLARSLGEAGFPVTAEDILSAPVATAAYLTRHHPGARCLLLTTDDISEDLPGITLVGPDDPDVDVVVLGGAGPAFGFDALDRAFRHLRAGAHLVAMHRNLYWRTQDGLRLDAGAFLLGLERASGVDAEVTGKPSGAFFASALERVGVDAAHALMIGDDVESDVLAAQRSGLTGVLVRTGKFLPDTLRTASGTPDHVIDSIAALPALLGLPER